MKIDLLKTHKELQDRSFITPQLLVNPQIKPVKYLSVMLLTHSPRI